MAAFGRHVGNHGALTVGEFGYRELKPLANGRIAAVSGNQHVGGHRLTIVGSDPDGAPPGFHGFDPRTERHLDGCVLQHLPYPVPAQDVFDDVPEIRFAGVGTVEGERAGAGMGLAVPDPHEAVGAGARLGDGVPGAQAGEDALGCAGECVDSQVHGPGVPFRCGPGLVQADLDVIRATP